MSLFQNSVLNKYLKGLESEKVTQAYERFISHFHNPTIQENIRNSKEEQYQGEFLIDLFVNVLGYTKNPTPNFNLTTELKNIKGSKKTDGAILSRGLNPLAKALAVIELKGTNTTDLSKVETQAFGYKNNQPGCNYVITSNFEKLRFYIDNAVDFEEFNLFQLSKERFDILWLCLSSEYLLKDIPKKIKDESLTQEENVTKKLYKDYASFRNEIFDAIQKENPEYDKLTLFKKTQKLLDRFLFIFFAEDRLLLPPNSIRSIVNQWTDLRDKYDAYFPLYDRFKKYFGYMNTGHKGQQHDIFAYNGGLFAPDEILDNIKINDDLLHKHTLNLSNYDFESEVSVNILGHIFEHSLNDIDEIQAEIQGVATEQSKTKRKKDGVFYTPKYITKYIVDHTVGKLCEEKKTELDIQEAEYEKERKGRQKATLKKLTQKLEDYRKWLLQITICDPACGSGAFLNQALEFLIAEHRYIDELQAKLFGDAMVLSEVENAILENNIYGVDINEESVEIAKLSLWLRTAQKGRKLTSLNNNIKCGNSLIDDPTVAGDKAFNWQKEFPEVFKEKDKKAYHITTALHDSRTSQRMIDYKVRERRDLGTNPLPNYTKLTSEEEILISETIIDIVKEDQINIMAYNICGDHLHLLLVCEEEQVPKIIQKIKAKTARTINIERGVTTTREHAPLPTQSTPLPRGKKQNSLWTQKYGCKEIKDDTQLHNTINYIQTNRSKHELPNNKALQSLVTNPILNQDYDKVFAVEYTGGFDVVIGNPPYVGTKQIDESDRNFYWNRFEDLLFSEMDLYQIFLYKSINEFLGSNGRIGFITPNSYFTNVSFKNLRNYIINETSINEIIDFPYRFYPFKDVNTETSIIIITKIINEKNKTILKTVDKSLQLKYKGLLDVFRNQNTLNQSDIKEKYDSKIIINTNSVIDKLISLKNTFGTYLNLHKGWMSVPKNIKEENNIFEKGIFNTNEVKTSEFLSKYCVKYLEGRDIHRYYIDNVEKYVFAKYIDNKTKSWHFNPKIILQRIVGQNKNKIFATVDFTNKIIFPNANLVNLNNSDDDVRFYLAVLNSNLISYYYNLYFGESNTNLTKLAFESIPIPDTLGLNKELYINKAQNLIDLNTNYQLYINRFLTLLASKFNIEKASKKLQNWHELEFGEFLKELEKARKKEAKNANKGFQPLALQEQAEWMQYFNEQKQKAAKLKAEIDKTDKEIDAMVYQLYGLTNEEIAIVEDACK